MRNRLRFARLIAISGILASGGSLYAQNEDVLSVPANQGTDDALALESEVQQGNSLFLAQWVRLSASSSVNGSVVRLVGNESAGVGRARVTLLQGNAVVGFADTDVTGDFSIQNVQPGFYSLVARSDNSIAVFALTVLDPVAGSHLPEQVQVRVLTPVTPRVNELLYGQSLPTVWTRTNFVPSADPIKSNRVFAPSHQVNIDAQGAVTGRLSRANNRAPLTGVTTYLFKDGREVARTVVATDGTFRFANVTPGVYGLVASGVNGFAALSFYAGKADVANSTSVKSKFVSFEADSSGLNVELADTPGIAQTQNAEVPPPPMEEQVVGGPTPGFGGGFGGGGAGGGIGSGGGRGLASLLAIGGLTTAAVVASATKNNNNTVSPVTP